MIRLENVLEKLLIVRELSIEQNLDYQEEIRKVFTGVKIVSKYNHRCYIIEDLCFDMNTESTFELRTSGECFHVSYFDYFTKRYQQTITQKKQPMIRAIQADPKASNATEAKSCFLVPELCHLVGMTDQMRNRRHTWREIK